MKINQSLKLYVTLFTLFLSFGFSHSALAATYSQTNSDTSTTLTGGYPNFFLQYMGDNIIGVPTQLEIYSRSNYASSTSNPRIYACDISRATSTPPSAYPNYCPSITATNQYQPLTNTKALYTFNFASTTFNLTGKRVYIYDSNPSANFVTGYSYGSNDPSSYPNGACATIQNGGGSVLTWGSCGSIKDLYFRLSTDGLLPPDQSESKIISFSPANGTTTTTNVTFNYQVYIAEDDISFWQGYRMLFYVQEQPVGFGKYFIDNVSATTTGYFTYSTTTTMAAGNYILNACLEKYYLGNLIGGFGTSCQYHQFIVGTSTFIGNLFQSGIDSVQTQINTITATSSVAILGNYCNLFSGFDIIQCLYALFIPTSSQLQNTMNTFYSDFLTRAPWGYGTVAVSRLLGYGTTATTSLAASNLTIVLPNTGVFATATSTAILKGKTMTFIDWNRIASSTVQNYWAPALNPINNFLNIMMGGAFIFWLYHFFKKMRP